jgi:hypothetical protein
MHKTITYALLNGAFTVVKPLFIMVLPVFGRPVSAKTTLLKYIVPEKRSLAVKTAQFINIFTQSALDKDSVVSLACRITGMPFPLP